MMYPLIQLDDLTEIVHSDITIRGERESVKVYIEKPIQGGFHSAECYLPEYEWKNVRGFTAREITGYQEVIESMVELIYSRSKVNG